MYKIDSGEGESFFAAFAGIRWSAEDDRVQTGRDRRIKRESRRKRAALNRRKADVQRNLLSQYRFKGENHYTV